MKVEESIDGTRKLIFNEGYIAVVIPTKGEKYSVCVSSQVGCPIGCTFCYTGSFVRNLSSDEIVEQVRQAAKIIGKNPTSIVYMGMGEPMSNFVQVRRSIAQIHTEFDIAYKRITVSTSGVLVNKLLDEPFLAALSLHTMKQDVRNKIIPHSLPIHKLLQFVDVYCAKRKNGIMIAYTLMKGVNDSDSDIVGLISHNWPKNVFFNLIEYNNKGDLVKSERLEEFKRALREKGYKCFIRESRGKDIEAACGMLDYSN